MPDEVPGDDSICATLARLPMLDARAVALLRRLDALVGQARVKASCAAFVQLAHAHIVNGAPRGAAGVAAPRALAPLAPPAPSGWDIMWHPKEPFINSA